MVLFLYMMVSGDNVGATSSNGDIYEWTLPYPMFIDVWDTMTYQHVHNNGVTWVVWRLKSSTTRMFVQKFVDAGIKETTKGPY